MVIFHSYVSLPEGRSIHPFAASSHDLTQALRDQDEAAKEATHRRKSIRQSVRSEISQAESWRRMGTKHMVKACSGTQLPSGKLT